jgi:hypothetical protein
MQEKTLDISYRVPAAEALKTWFPLDDEYRLAHKQPLTNLARAMATYGRSQQLSVFFIERCTVQTTRLIRSLPPSRHCCS